MVVPARSRKRKLEGLSSPQQPYVIFLKDMIEVAKGQFAHISFNDFQSQVAKEWKFMPQKLRQHWDDRARVENKQSEAPMQQQKAGLTTGGNLVSQPASTTHDQVKRPITRSEEHTSKLQYKH